MKPGDLDGEEEGVEGECGWKGVVVEQQVGICVVLAFLLFPTTILSPSHSRRIKKTLTTHRYQLGWFIRI